MGSRGIDQGKDVDNTTELDRWGEDIYRRYCQRVFRTCLRFAGSDREWAYDRTHDVFMKFFENIESVQNRKDPGGWLYRVAVNTCFAALRRERIAKGFLGALRLRPTSTGVSSEITFQAKRTISALETAIHALPTPQRAVVVLMHLDDKTQTETAKLLGMSQGQVSKLHSRAMATLKRQEWDLVET